MRPEPTQSARHPRLRFFRAIVWTMWVVAMVGVAISLVTADGLNDLLQATAFDLTAISFVTAGAVLVTRLPTNPIGWLLASGGFWFGVGNGATSLAIYGLIRHPGSVPGAVWLAWLDEWTWAPAVGAVLLLVLAYPTGRLLSKRWRPLAVGDILLIVLLSFGGAFGPWTDGQFPVANPLAITGTVPDLVSFLLGPVAILVALLTVTSMVIRFRRSSGIERAQLKWFVAVVAVSLPAFLIGTSLFGSTGTAGVIANLFDLVAFVGFALLPVAIGLAVLRYRLYEIDRVISRTIGWGMVTIILGALFVGLVLGLQTLVAPLTRSNELAVAGSTLLVAALFQPLRRQVQGLVDRRFNRSRYDAQQAVDVFSARLRDEVDLETVQEALLTIVNATLEPTAVSLWLRE